MGRIFKPNAVAPAPSPRIIASDNKPLEGLVPPLTPAVLPGIRNLGPAALTKSTDGVACSDFPVLKPLRASQVSHLRPPASSTDVNGTSSAGTSLASEANNPHPKRLTWTTPAAMAWGSPSPDFDANEPGRSGSAVDKVPQALSVVRNDTIEVECPRPGFTFALLASLQCTPGILEPNFSPTTLLYTLIVPAATSEVSISAESNDGICSIHGVCVGQENKSQLNTFQDCKAKISITYATQQFLLHVDNGTSTTPYQITVLSASSSTFLQLQQKSHSNSPNSLPPVVCDPTEPPPDSPPISPDGAPVTDGSNVASYKRFVSVMLYNPRDQAHTLHLKPGDSVDVISVSTDPWWPVRRAHDGEIGWVPAVCLRPKVSSSGETPLQPDNMTELVSLSKNSVMGMDTVEYVSTIRAITRLTDKELGSIELGIQKQLSGPHKSRRFHVPVHFPKFCFSLVLIQILTYIISLSVHGAVSLYVNPMGGMGWSGFRNSGSCWPPDLRKGHIYSPLTALIVPAGGFRLIFDVALLLLLIRRTEKLYGFWRASFTFLVCGIGGHITAALFAPLWITTGPGPGLMGMLMWMLLELPKQGKDIAVVVAMMAISLLLGGFPGCGIWSQLGGMVFGLAAKLMNTLSIGSRTPSCTFTIKYVGVGLGCALVLSIVTGLVLTRRVSTSCHRPSDQWCPRCELACYDAHNWCSPDQLNRCTA